MRILRFLRHLLAKFPRLLIASTLLWIAVSLLEAVSVLAVAPVIDYFLGQPYGGASRVTLKFNAFLGALGLPQTMVCVLTVFILLAAASSLLQILGRDLLLKAKYALLQDLIDGTFQDFFRARWSFFQDMKQGMLINTFLREISLVGDAFGSMSLFFANALKLALYLVVPFAVDWRVTSISLGVAAVLAAPLFLLGKVAYRQGRQNTATANEFASTIHENLTMAKLILGFANAPGSLARINRAYGAHRDATLKSQTLDVAIPLLYYPVGLGVMVTALLAAKSYGVPLSDTSILFYSLFKAVPIVGLLAAQKNSLENFFPSHEQVEDLRGRARQMLQRTGTRPHEGLRSGITLEDVTFAHPGHEPTLTGVTLTIPKGKMVTFVGESGAGKSTMIDLLMGFQEPSSGKLRIDGRELSEFDLASYRLKVGYVPQDSVLFNMTLRENLLWAHPQAAENDLSDAIRRANAEEFVRDLPQGLDTRVGDRGTRLSGGQIQRIALARALLKKPDILILDEATSALDSRSEKFIREAVESLAGATTLVVIAHRLSTIANADVIYVLSRGRLVQSGGYKELIAADGPFKRMAELQSLETASPL